MLTVASGVIPLQSSVVLLARIVGSGGQYLTPASVASCGYRVRDLTSQVEVTSGLQALVVASVVFGSLQLDARWTLDSLALPGADGYAGYNFAATIPGTLFASYDVTDTVSSATPNTVASHAYQVDVKFTMTDGSVLVVPFKVATIPSYV